MGLNNTRICAVVFSLFVSIFFGTAAAQLQPAEPAKIPKDPVNKPLPVMPVINTTDHCKAGAADWTTAPRWSEVKAKNKGWFDPVGGPTTFQTGTVIVGVPDLDNPLGPGGYIDLNTGLLNISSLMTNALSVLKNPGQLIQGQGDKPGLGICRTSPDHNGDTHAIAYTEISYCDYQAVCGQLDFTTTDDPNVPGPYQTGPNEADPTNGKIGKAFIWVPENTDFFHKIESKTGLDIMEAADGTYFILPNAYSTEAREKWSLKLVKLLDTWADPSSKPAIQNLTNTLNIIKERTDEFREWWDEFSGHVNRTVEGYHLGAYDEMRPDLHLCVGYYGHKTRSDLFSLLDGKITLGSSYNSHNISKAARAQVRTGGMNLTAFSKQLNLLATPEVNIQMPTLEIANCDAPFGVNINTCLAATNIGVAQCDGAQYLSPENLGGGSSNQFSLMPFTDYSDVNFGDGTGVKWPRKTAIPVITPGSKGPQSQEKLITIESDLPTTGVMSAGFNYGQDWTLPDPRPKPLGQPFSVGPVMGQFKWDLEYGLKWFHDSNHLKNIIVTSLESIAIEGVMTRDMHAMQAEDLTADDGSSFYTKPSILLALGYMWTAPKERAKLNISLDLGLHLDLEPSFYGGIADMNLAMKDAMLAVNNNEGLECNPVYADEMVDVATYCSAENYLADNAPLSAGHESVNAGDQVKPGEIYYICEESKPGVSSGSDGTILPCEDFGMCQSADGNVHNVSPGACRENQGLYVPYTCKSIQKTEIVGWNGPGCSPLLDGAGFPSAPGGMCTPPSNTNVHPVVGPCTDGNSCVEGACLPTCNSDADCGDSALSCNTGSSVCEHVGGLPFAEQIEWAATYPAPGDPLHSVWSHAASKLEAKLDFSLGYDLKFWLRLFGKDRKIVDEVDSKYWTLVDPEGRFKYEIGMSADYDNSCNISAGGVEDYQTPDPDFTIDLTRAINDNVDGMTSEAFIDACIDDLPDDVTAENNMPDQPTDDAIADNIHDAYDFSEDIALEAWEDYGDDICINGQPWEDWVNGWGDPEKQTLGPSFAVNVAGTNTSQSNAEAAILAASGCLKPNKFSAVSASIAAAAGTDGNGDIDIFAHLVDSSLGLQKSNIGNAVSGHTNFNAWWAAVDSCIDAYIATGAVTMDVDVGPCEGSDAVEVNTDNPNDTPQDTGVIIDRPGRILKEGMKVPETKSRNNPAKPEKRRIRDLFKREEASVQKTAPAHHPVRKSHYEKRFLQSGGR